MAGFEDVLKKAFYMGVGFASYAQEKAGSTFGELKIQAQKLADEMIARGEMSTEEARKFVDDIVTQAQQGTVPGATERTEAKEPRRIEIIDEQEQSTSSGADDNTEDLRRQVLSLQEELRRLKNNS